MNLLSENLWEKIVGFLKWVLNEKIREGTDKLTKKEIKLFKDYEWK